MRTPILGCLLVVSLASGCSPDVVPCRFDIDCAGDGQQCQEGFCVERVEDAGKKVKDAGVDAGHPDGGEPDADAGMSVDAGMDAGACMPRRCSDVGANCGDIPDLCGGTLHCGSCQAPEVCGAVHPGQCACKPKTCADLNATCGTNIPDGCGGTIASCGPVPNCGGGPSFCNGSYQCDCKPIACADVGAMCGSVPNGCGQMLNCGDTSCGGMDHECDANKCVCAPAMCPANGCGVVSNHCGNTVDCGPTDCGGNDKVCVSNVCECAAAVCPANGCGMVTNRCGNTVDCGNPSCGGGQHFCDSSHQCQCTPLTPSQVSATCGSVPNGCGGTLMLGTCGPFQVCGSQNTCVCASSIDAPDDSFQDTNCDGIDGDKNAAIFVSASGNDANSGVFGQPVATLNQAIARAGATFKHAIYISAGTYAAPTTAWPNGMNLYGGYDASWNRNALASNRALLMTLTSGWLLQSISTATTIERVVIKSAATVSPGESSQAMRMVGCNSSLAIRYTDIIAVVALAGAAGSPGAAGAHGKDGDSGLSAVPGSPSESSVHGLTNGGAAAAGFYSGPDQGGPGGVGGSDVNNQPNGGNGMTNWYVDANGYKVNGDSIFGLGSIGGCGTIAPGGWGGSGLHAGAAGSPGSAGYGGGNLSAMATWQPAMSMMGISGASGGLGSGGGGGGGGGMLACGWPTNIYQGGGSGGGGGAGGLGGAGGMGGRAGGSSIALALLSSSPTLNNVAITAGNGGNGGVGGNGGAAGVGGRGGAGGQGVTIDPTRSSGWGGPGGNGANGGAGGAGGAGSGGSSIGIWCQSSTSFSGGNAVTFTIGAAGQEPGTPSSAGPFNGPGYATQKYNCP
jgi:hypothetical protein